MKILIFGPESSGSAMLTRIIGKHLGLIIGGYGSTTSPDHTLTHTSLPSSGKFPNIEQLVEDHDRVIITIRDNTISQLSKIQRFKKDPIEAEIENNFAREWIQRIITLNPDCYIWSYEAFIYLQDTYLEILLSWLGLQPVEYEQITDENRKYIL